MAQARRLLQGGVSQLLNYAKKPFSLTGFRLMSDGRLFVGGLSFRTTEESLRTAFAAHGELVEVKIMNDRETGKSRGFGFVTYANDESADAAVSKLNGQMLDGRLLRVNHASDRPAPGPRAGGFGAGGGYGGYGASGGTSAGGAAAGGAGGGYSASSGTGTTSMNSPLASDAPGSSPTLSMSGIARGSAPSMNTGSTATAAPSKPVSEPLFLSDPPGSPSSAYSPPPPRPRNKYNRGGSYGRSSSSSYASGLYDDLASEYGGGSSSRSAQPAVRYKKVHDLVVDDDSDGEGNFGFCR